MKGHEIRNIAAPSADNSVVSKKWVNTEIDSKHFLRKGGGFMTGGIDMGSHEVKGLGDPTTDASAVSKKWVTDHVSGSSISSSGFTMTGDIDMGGHRITGLPNGSGGDSSALSSKTIDTWGLQFVKRDGGTLASKGPVIN
jgi:hypothetical protein